jgi:hypothetical protein
MKSLAIYLLAAVGSGLVKAQGVLKIESTHSEACTRRSKSGDVISVNYNGTLTDGKAFDSSSAPPSKTTQNQDYSPGLTSLQHTAATPRYHSASPSVMGT